MLSAPIETKIVTATRWITRIERLVKANERLMLLAEDPASQQSRSIRQELENRLHLLVQVISSQSATLKSFWPRASHWFGALGIMAGFCGIQSRLLQYPKNWSQPVLLCISVVTEFLLISRWNWIADPTGE